jgi:glycosyltransferase involved in cell wall biosynthesis
MRIAFGDFCDWDFHAQSPELVPLGGSQSAACYLAQSLARQGHEVFLLNGTKSPGRYGGVTCLSWAQTPPAILRGLRLDVFVCLLGGVNGRIMRGLLGGETRLVLWTQHRVDQPAVQCLDQPAEREAYEAFVFASEWQRAEFIPRFGLAPERTQALRNAVAPAFLDLFPAGQPILPQKAMPPVLAYTSTPFRGLHLLVEAFPAIRAQVPDLRLRVFSSMQVYQESSASDQAMYGSLYQRCRQTPGIEYVGSIPQPLLAREMRSVSVLAYPNIFPETFCIAALEAMASGCGIVTSALGALPETTAGFARLISVEQDSASYLREFVANTVAVLQEMQRADATAEEKARRQVVYIQQNATWDVRAREWTKWLTGLCGWAAIS